MKEPATIPPSVMTTRHIMPKAQAKPMIRMVSRMLMKRLGARMKKKGLTTGDVKIKEKKIKYW